MQGTPRGTSRLIPRAEIWNRHVQDTKPRAIYGTAKYNTYRVKHVTTDVSKDNNAAIVRVETATDWLRRLWHCSPWKLRGTALTVTWLKISVCINTAVRTFRTRAQPGLRSTDYVTCLAGFTTFPTRTLRWGRQRFVVVLLSRVLITGHQTCDIPTITVRCW